MRNILVVTLALAPVLVHAQAASPAQPGANVPVLESKLVSPKAVNGGAGSTAIRRTSELLEPKLIKWGDVVEAPLALEDVARLRERFITVSMTVTEHGIPMDLKVIDSDDPLLNRNVLDAVAQYRFTPGSLNSKPTAIPLLLKVRVLPQPR